MKTFIEQMVESMNPSNISEPIVQVEVNIGPVNEDVDMPAIVPIVNSTVTEELEVALNLAVRAADVIQMAHWNLRSPNFVTLHLWFGEKYGELLLIADGIAEQIKIKNIDNIVTLKRIPVPGLVDEQSILRYVKITLSAAIQAIMNASKNTAIDAPTKNLLEGWQGDLEKMKWFITSSITV